MRYISPDGYRVTLVDEGTLDTVLRVESPDGEVSDDIRFSDVDRAGDDWFTELAEWALDDFMCGRVM